MPRRIVKSPIHVVRNGVMTEPPLNSVFDFTEAELADIKAVNPDAIGHPVEEDKPVEIKAVATKV